jgi:hypothetical protein
VLDALPFDSVAGAVVEAAASEVEVVTMTPFGVNTTIPYFQVKRFKRKLERNLTRYKRLSQEATALS